MNVTKRSSVSFASLSMYVSEPRSVWSLREKYHLQFTEPCLVLITAQSTRSAASDLGAEPSAGYG